MDSQKSIYREQILLGKFSRDELHRIINESSGIEEPGTRIAFLSGKFLNTDYSESTLIGNKDTQEVFVINLKEVDCLTFIEYIEAMRLSDSFSVFVENVKKIRYKSGIVSFENRNHFFIDWKKYNSDSVVDITERMSTQGTIKVQKFLNKKDDGTYFLPGIQPVLREIAYIPSGAIDDLILGTLSTGDYIGIYSHAKGLDVSHAGIIIKDRENIYLRHASSQKDFRKVIDQDFKNYIVNKPGIIVLRPKSI